MKLPEQSLAERFQQYFDVDFAGSRELKSAVYRIRYRVYCEDLEYEPSAQFPDRLERDEFDEHSLHCLITHRRSGKHAACVRLVASGGENQGELLPFEKNCPGIVAPEFYSQRGLQRENMCEISRLAVDRMFRRRSGEQVTRLGEENAFDCTQQEMRTFSLIAVAGFLAATALTEITGHTEVFAMMEPFLPRLMKRSGIVFQRAGEDLDYHGTRAPYFIKTEWAINNMRPDLRELYESIHRQVGRTYSTYQHIATPKKYEAFR